MHRTYFRTFTTTAAMVLVSFLLIGAAFGFASRQVFVSEARESMMTNSREISRMAVAYAAEGDLRSLELRMTLSTIGASTNQHIFIVNPSGYIITCSDSAVFCEHIGKRLDEERNGDPATVRHGRVARHAGWVLRERALYRHFRAHR